MHFEQAALRQGQGPIQAGPDGGGCLSSACLEALVQTLSGNGTDLNEVLHHCPAGTAKAIRQERGPAKPVGLPQLLDPVFLSSDVADERFVIASELAPVPNVTLGNKAAFQETRPKPGGNPPGIAHIGLLARYMLQVPGVNHPQVHVI